MPPLPPVRPILLPMHPLARSLTRSLIPFLLGLVGSVLAFAGQTGEADQNLAFGVASVAWRDGLPAVCWWLGAWGFGIGLGKLATGPSVRAITLAAAGERGDGSDRTGLDELAVALGLGAAFLLAIDSALGTLGVARAAGGVLAWLVIAIGVVVGARILRDAPVRLGAGGGGSESAGGSPWIDSLRGAVLGVATGLLMVAASVAPGWLWSSEFAGFDALSYHLPLPKEWFLAGGVVRPVEGNIYSALPSFVESAFLHLMILRANPIDGALACQWWSMLATLASAFVTARLARRAIGDRAGFIAAVLFLATPWTTVVGTLAYNDMFPVLALASAWLLVGPTDDDARPVDARLAAALALLAAAAFGAKPSSLFFTALPMCAAVWAAGGRTGGARNFRVAPVALAVGLAVLSPWLVRNQLHYGSPTFPFLSGVFGLGPWSAEQLGIFLNAHSSPGSLWSKLPLIWQQWIGYGFGAAPVPNEPWFPLWGVLPIAGIVGLVVAVRPPAGAANRRWRWVGGAMLLVMVAGWLLGTHAKSRFLLPSAVPLTLGATALLVVVSRRAGLNLATGVACGMLLLPVAAFLREPVSGTSERRAPALLVNGVSQVTGAALAEALPALPQEEQAKFVQQAQSSFILNYTLPKDARLVGIGFSTPFYILRPIAWTTVWDRGEFDRVVDEAPGTPAAWGVRLRMRGFTHAVVSPVMLTVWARSGWLNPALANDRWLRPFLESNRLFARTADGILVVELGVDRDQGTAGVTGSPTPG